MRSAVEKISSISARSDTFSCSSDGIILQGNLRCYILSPKELPHGQPKKHSIAEVGSICTLTERAGQLHGYNCV